MDTKKLKEIEKNEFLKKVYSYVVESSKLNRRDARIFFRLQGLLLKNDLPVTYPTAKLAEKEQYSTRSVDRALNSLEGLGLIERMGCSYKRRFIKGVKLMGIIIEVQNSINLYQEENHTPMSNYSKNALKKNNTSPTLCHSTSPLCHGTKPESQDTTSKCHTIEFKEEFIELNNTTVAVGDKNKKNEPQRHVTEKPAPYEIQLREAYRNKPYVHGYIKTEDDFIDYCRWSINHDRPENITIAGRVKMLIKFHSNDELEISEKWIKTKKVIKATHNQEYQEYAGDITQRIKYGLLPKDTKIMTIEAFLEEKRAVI